MRNSTHSTYDMKAYWRSSPWFSFCRNVVSNSNSPVVMVIVLIIERPASWNGVRWINNNNNNNNNNERDNNIVRLV